MRDGAVIKKTRLTQEFDFAAFRRLHGDTAIPLFLIRESGQLAPFTVTDPPTPKPGTTLISLVDPRK